MLIKPFNLVLLHLILLYQVNKISVQHIKIIIMRTAHAREAGLVKKAGRGKIKWAIDKWAVSRKSVYGSVLTRTECLAGRRGPHGHQESPPVSQRIPKRIKPVVLQGQDGSSGCL